MGMSLGIGLSPSFGVGRPSPGGSGGAISIALHSRYVGIGDSITSQSSTKGFRNWVETLSFKLLGVLEPAVSCDQGVGGDTMAQILARINNTINQKPQVVFCMWAHNDGFAAGTTAARIASNRANLNALRAGLPTATIIWHATLSSTVGTEDPTVLAAFNSDGQAWCAADGNAIFLRIPPTWDPTSGTHTIDGTHPNITGCFVIVNDALTTLTPYMPTTDVLTQTSAFGSYGANADTEYGLTGTGGTKTGTVTPTGNVATGKEVTNNLTNGTAVAVVCDNQTLAGTQRIDVTGTPSAANTLVWDEAGSSNVNLSIGAGGFADYLIGVTISATDGVSAPVGIQDMGLALGSVGVWGSSNSASTVNVPEKVTGVMRVRTLVCFVAITTINAATTWRFALQALGTRLSLDRSIVRQRELVAYAAPFYCGDDGLILTNGKVGITGATTTGSLLTGKPGTWSGGACVLTYQWNRYSTVDDSFVSAVVGATSLTYTTTVGETGFKMGQTVTATNSFGSASKASALTAAIT